MLIVLDIPRGMSGAMSVHNGQEGKGNMSMIRARVRVALGVAFLGEKAPGWVGRMPSDGIGSDDMYDADRCIAGRTWNEEAEGCKEYESGFSHFGHDHLVFCVLGTDDRGSMPVSHGFVADENASEGELADAWNEAIGDRRAETR